MVNIFTFVGFGGRSPLWILSCTHVCASKHRVQFLCEIFQFGKSIMADLFPEALHSLSLAPLALHIFIKRYYACSN